MSYNIPPTALIRRRLGLLTQAQLHQLASDTGVPYSTLVKIKYAETKNPGIETVAQFFQVLMVMTGTDTEQQQDE
jgi:predicted transcriptional regulator